MHAGLRVQQAVSVGSLDGDGDVLDPRVVPRQDVDDLGLEPLDLEPTHVHPQQHLGPVLRFGPAGTGVDGQDRIPLVILGGESALHLQPANMLRQIG